MPRPHQVKVMIIGPMGSGKSALLVDCLAGRPFPKESKPTVTMNCSQIELREDVLLDVCDYSGEANLSPSPYLGLWSRGAGLVVYCLDHSKPLQEQKKYLEKVHQHIKYNSSGCKPAFVLVTTKLEDKDGRDMKAQELESFYQEMGKNLDCEDRVTFSAQAGKNLETLKSLVDLKIEEFLREKENKKSSQTAGVNLADDVATSFKIAKQIPFPGTISKALVDKFEKQFDEVHQQIVREEAQGQIKKENAVKIAEACLALKKDIVMLTPNLPNQVSKFREIVTPCIETPLLDKMIGGLIGAMLGLCAGAMLGAWLGPGAALTALTASVHGAVLGATFGAAALGGTTGAWFSMWREKRNHPLNKLAYTAESFDGPRLTSRSGVRA